MRVNVYAEEITDRVEIISKEIDGTNFTGLRFYLELPVTQDGKQVQGPFLHRPGDDDSSAVTFWGKRALKDVLRKALSLLEAHHKNQPQDQVWAAAEDENATLRAKIDEIESGRTAMRHELAWSNIQWYVRDAEGGLEEYMSDAEALDAAHALLDHYRDNASDDGWPPDIGCLEWGVLLPIESAHIEVEPAPEGSSFDEHWSVRLEPTGVQAPQIDTTVAADRR